MTWGEKPQRNPGWGCKLMIDIYDTVHVALWSILITGIIFFCAFTLPNIPRIQAEVAAKRFLEISAENRGYCEK